MAVYKIYKRTFEATRHPKGSDERIRLNQNAVTSEYMPKDKFAIVSSALADNGQPLLVNTTRTRIDAEALAASYFLGDIQEDLEEQAVQLATQRVLEHVCKAVHLITTRTESSESLKRFMRKEGP